MRGKRETTMKKRETAFQSRMLIYQYHHLAKAPRGSNLIHNIHLPGRLLSSGQQGSRAATPSCSKPACEQHNPSETPPRNPPPPFLPLRAPSPRPGPGLRFSRSSSALAVAAGTCRERETE
ncbi:hypothetical protein ElyMa_003590100 [Elysia marginata]|uniref:Uncharacterized protein n=1 Tax=Elysia marginata TaxID=1093978 RepID=A0AAV4EPR5_9GAST|nr:hypothetical protein ElyMa_003590100 [Elysia marginata]